MQAANNNKSQSGQNGWFKAIFLLLVWLLMLSLVRDVWHIRVGFKRVEDSKIGLEIERRKNEELKKKYELVQTSEYREMLIREKLNMQKEGELLVVLPKGSQNYQKIASEQEKTVEIQQNWEKWFRILY